MNLLTDIITDVAKEVGVVLTEEEKLNIQKATFDQILNRVSWCKHDRIAKEGFPWLDRGEAIHAIV